MQDIVVVVPCYNEEQRFPSASFVRAARQDPTVSFVLVDDGSKDKTRTILERLGEKEGDQFCVLGLERNGGKAEAVRRGFQHAFERSSSLVAYLDADLATPLTELDSMRALFHEQLDLQAVLGSRVALLGRRVVRRPVRHYFGRLFASLASLSLGVTVYDTQCGAKVFRNTAAVRSIFNQRFATRWTFDVEILARLRALSREGVIAPLPISAAEYPLSSWQDVSGSKVGPLDGLKAMTELLSLGLQYRHGWQRSHDHTAYTSVNDPQWGRTTKVPESPLRSGEFANRTNKSFDGTPTRQRSTSRTRIASTAK